ncbi:hypothetical protein ET475_08780 [Microbacterium protaetiae]|uniref:Flagellar FliJ protein n=1 Tax=Microbacterium protaetiae TaxID=2509458 RepID=A0A4P6EF99_9MICO|nr:hypothetical protein [Microbacterium protaetiae]QAY60073.1 hypothetical protein ET475_08780 [Microbacterium protaetiae]
MTRFSLAGLLRVRSAQEREAAQRLSRATIEAGQTEARNRQLRAALGGADSDIPDVRALAALAAARAAGRSLLADLSAVSALQQQTLERTRAAHGERRREVKGLEKLAQAHSRHAHVERLRSEQLELDEIAARMQGQADG